MRRSRKRPRARKRKKFGRYPYTMLLAISLVLLFLFADTALVHTLIRQIGSFGYFGALITGVFSVSLFTVAPSYVVLVHLAQDFNPFLIALFGGVGGLVGDYILFRFVKDGLYHEWRPWILRIGRSAVGRALRTRRMRVAAPLIGAAVIASPLPDELGVGLMGMAHLKTWQFAALALALNIGGIYAVIIIAANLVA